MKPPRGLTAEEAAAWARLAATVVPLNPPSTGEDHAQQGGGAPRANPKRLPEAPAVASSVAQRVELARKPRVPLPQPSAGPPPRVGEDGSSGLDSHWDRRFRAGAIEPDFTLDLHGLTLDGAHARLDDGLAQAKAMGARVVLLIAGKPRPVEAADRGSRRGAIRAKILDWLAAGPHGSSIAAVRSAHRRHGGEGALYLVLKKRG